jgi:aspartate/methionine/tyrosine aminotransferase
MARDNAIEPLALDKILDLCDASAAAGTPVTDLCSGSSMYDITPLVDFSCAGAELAPAIRYGELQGRETLRVRLSELYANEYGLDISPSRFLITDGASGALAIALMTLLDPGDQVILPAVGFPIYKTLVQMVGAECVFAPLDEEFKYDIGALRQLITKRTRVIIVNSPSNPHGAVLTRPEMEQLLALGLDVISDEVYRLLAHDHSAISFSELTDRHFVVDSFSKAYALAGFRIGYAIVPAKYASTARTIKATLNVSTSLPAQILAERVLQRHDTLIHHHRTYLEANRDLFLDLCRANGLAVVLRPTAGFYGLIDVSAAAPDSFELARDLIGRYHVAVCPSFDFGRPDPRFFRINFSCPPQHIQDALPKIAAFLKTVG